MNVIYFDGLCNLCDGFISFLFRLGMPQHIKVTSFQGDYAQEHLPQRDRKELSSVLYQTPERTYRESSAVIHILSDMKPYFFPLKVLLIIPYFLRDPIYRLIAKNRYSLFGKKETCRLPTEKERDSFL